MYGSNDVPARINMAEMNIDQMVLTSRLQFNRVINPADKDEDQVRQEFRRAMISHSLDLDEDERNEAAAIKAQKEKVIVPVAPVQAVEPVDPVESVMVMDKPELIEWLSKEFKVNADKRKSLETLREQAVALIHGEG